MSDNPLIKNLRGLGNENTHVVIPNDIAKAISESEGSYDKDNPEFFKIAQLVHIVGDAVNSDTPIIALGKTVEEL